MNVTEARIKLVDNRTDRLKAFCTITFDNSFVVRDLKVIEGSDGYFVAMPSRKLTERCPRCGGKNNLRSRFCSDCGARLPEFQPRRGPGGRTKLHADVAHPVNSQCRAYIQGEIIAAYEREVALSQEPGYQPTELGDDYEENYPGQLTCPAAGDTTAPPEQSTAPSESVVSNPTAVPDNDMAGTASMPLALETPQPGDDPGQLDSNSPSPAPIIESTESGTPSSAEPSKMTTDADHPTPTEPRTEDAPQDQQDSRSSFSDGIL